MNLRENIEADIWLVQYAQVRLTVAEINYDRTRSLADHAEMVKLREECDDAIAKAVDRILASVTDAILASVTDVIGRTDLKSTSRR
jgi:hypothetical protein